MCSRFQKGRGVRKPWVFTMFFAPSQRARRPKHLVIYNVFAPSEGARCPKTMYFTWFSRPRKGRSGQKHCILQCFRACGKGEVSKTRVFYIVFAPSEKAQRPITLYFLMFSRLQKGRGVQNPCILQCFRALGKGAAAKHFVVYNMFAPSEKAQRPNTLYFTMFSRLRKGRSGPKPCVLKCFRALGKGETAQKDCFS